MDGKILIMRAIDQGDKRRGLGAIERLDDQVFGVIADEDVNTMAFQPRVALMPRPS